jgi:hypothetical protein
MTKRSVASDKASEALHDLARVATTTANHLKAVADDLKAAADSFKSATPVRSAD